MWLIEYELEPVVQCNSDFWLYNFQLFYDLNRRCYAKHTHDIEDTKMVDLHYEKSDAEVAQLAINDFPTEMLSRIFSFLTAVDLLVVRDVCRRWSDIVAVDKALWNHAHFSAVDLDVKTTISLLKEMPLLRSVELCNVHSADDMTRLVAALCHKCWDLRQIHFPESCEWHPSSVDLHQLSYYHPCISSLHLSTRQKLTGTEITNIGSVLADFTRMTDLKLFGFYWQQPELLTEILDKIKHLTKLSLPSLPGLTNQDIKQLCINQPELKTLTINTSTLNKPHNHLQSFVKLPNVRVIDNSLITINKLAIFDNISRLTFLDINLSNCKKADVIQFFKKPRCLITLKVSNCEFSDELLTCLGDSCLNLRRLVWLNPKDVVGEVSDEGILALTRLTLLHSLEIKSRSVSKLYYTNLASMRNLKYARINGMRVPGCL